MSHNLTLQTRRALARGLSPRNGRRWAGAAFLSAGIGNRAKASFGAGNSGYQIFARKPGTGGNAVTFAVAVAGVSTPASVSVTGSAVTFNSATNASSVATSTVQGMREAVNSNPLARPLVHVQLVSGSDGTGAVAAIVATALTGAA